MVEDRRVACFGCSIATAVFLMIVLLPVSLSYVEYYEYGLDQRKTTGSVNADKVYTGGRYMLGVDHKFIKYQVDAHYHSCEYPGGVDRPVGCPIQKEFSPDKTFDAAVTELSVFSDGGTNDSIGLAVLIDIDYTYLLIKEEIGALHRAMASNYDDIITSRAREAIKNEAIDVKFSEYIRNRTDVEERFRQAVDRSWGKPPRLPCELDQFHLGRVQIDESVAAKLLQTRVQNERNDKEDFLQEASLEREATTTAVNSINLEREKALRTAEAEAALVRAKARAEAGRIVNAATIRGTRQMLESAGISTQDHISAFTYIQTLRNRGNLSIDVSYLSAESVLRTQSIAS